MADGSLYEFVAEYRDLLAQLKRNEKRDINVLSMLAEDNRQHAPAIVTAIEQHIAVVRCACARLGCTFAWGAQGQGGSSKGGVPCGAVWTRA